MTDACYHQPPAQEEEEEGDSEYEYEYETDSEYEYEEEEEDSGENGGQPRETAEASGVVKIHPVCIESVEAAPAQQVERLTLEQEKSQTQRLAAEKERIEAMKPKLPAYVTSPEPCAFSDDPCLWINWMEAQVTKERERRVKSRLDNTELEDRQVPEVEPPQQPPQEEEQHLQLAGAAVEEADEAEGEHNDDYNDDNDDDGQLMSTECNISNSNTAVNETSAEEADKETSGAVVQPLDNLVVRAEAGEDEGSEWEYEDEEEGGEVLVCDATDCDNDRAAPPPPASQGDDAGIATSLQNDERERGENSWGAQQEVVTSTETTGPTTADCQLLVEEPAAAVTASLEAVGGAAAEVKVQEKAGAAGSSGQTAGENPTAGASAGILDAETQRKLTFIRQRKAAAAAAKAAQPDSSTSCDGSSGSFLRQVSCPEPHSPARPQSIANDASLNDMLARIKTLREERKQILQDMSAIKNAFGGGTMSSSSMSTITTVEDDGIGSGNTTPCQEYGGENGLLFPDDSCRLAGGGTAAVPMTRRRGHRRSIDSGIGSKSLCSSIQDGSPTAELEAAGTPTDKSVLGSHSIDPHRRRISKEKATVAEEKDSGTTAYHCYICGENLGGRLTKGAAMHLGLEDGEPVCADYLYLTEESKERIRQVATTRMFDHEAKYQLLDTLDLEAWNVDYDEEDDMPTARNVMDKVDAFLVDIELQKQRDKERFDAMRSGAIDDVLHEEFAALLLQQQPQQLLPSDDNVVNPSQKESSRQQHPVQLSPAVQAAPPPPPPPPPRSSSTSSPQQHPPQVLQAVLQGIRDGGQQQRLKHTETTDRSEEQAGLGQVIHRHLAPIVFSRDIRSLVKDLAKDDHKKRLKKVRTVDKSRPFIPADVQIYFYGAAHADNKSAPPPPLSRLKFESSCLKR